MGVHFTPEQEAQLSEIARQAGTDAEHLVMKAALSLLERDARFRAAVHKGLEQADRGEFVDEGEMGSRIARMIQA
jgi:predicted transcriptional regulator